jgi:hypothetical protein
MTPLTLVYAGTEKWLGPDPAGGAAPAWGYSSPILRLVSRAASTLTLRKAGGDPAAAADIPYGGQITIYKDRVYAAGFSGGRIIFKGSRTDLNGIASPGEPAATMQFSDVWFNLSRQIYQHYWAARIGGVMVNFYYSRVNLFQDISAGTATPWTYNDVQAQITDIINYASGPLGLPIQLGTVDPIWQLPVYGVKAITCAEALLHCLRPIPDAVTYFDYTTTPPTLHIRQRANLTAVSLPYADGVKHQSSRIKSRPDLVPGSVVIQYQKTNQFNGVAYDTFQNDVYPALSTGAEPQAIVAPIDLRGGNITQVFGQVTADAIDPTLIAFWKAKKQDLNDASICGLAMATDATHPVKVYDHTGADITGTWAADWPNEISGNGAGGVAPWMYAGSTQITAEEATITAWVKYVKASTVGYANPLHTVAAHQVSCRVKLTNSAAGTINYSALQNYDPGDPAIVGLAQYLYTAASQLQWEGHHIIVEDSVSDIVVATVHYLMSPRFTLNLTGGNADWADMAAAIFDVEIDFFHGKTTVNFGPHAHLSAQEFKELLMFFVTRVIWDNPNIRSTGQNSAGSNVSLPTDGQKENTQHGVPEQDIHAIQSPLNTPASGQQVIIRHDSTDPTTGPYIAKTIKTSDGSTITTQTAGVDDAAHIFLRFSELVGKNKKVYFQPVHLCVDGVDKICYLPCTDPE